MSGIIINISEDRAGQRLDNFLLGRLKNVSRPRVYRMLRKGEVRVNKGRTKPDYRLKEGDDIRLPPEHTYITQTVVSEKKLNASADLVCAQRGQQESNSCSSAARTVDKASKTSPERRRNENTARNNITTYKQKASAILKDAILYEDDQLIVINKTAGIAVHGGSGLSFGLIELLREYWSEYHQLELVHRLDRETSGCLLLSKKHSMLRALHAMLREHKLQKTYHALVQGNIMCACEINLPLRKLEISAGRELVKVDQANGAAAVTKFKPLQHYAMAATLVEAQPITGKTHQIRVHAVAMGAPIAGDERYGDRQFNVEMRRNGLKRLFLHASKLEFECPKTNKLIVVDAPYDKTLINMLKLLGSLRV